MSRGVNTPPPSRSSNSPLKKMVLWEILGATGSASAVESRLFQHWQSQCHTFSTGWQVGGSFPGFEHPRTNARGADTPGVASGCQPTILFPRVPQKPGPWERLLQFKDI